MADKPIGDLTPATAFTQSDLLVMEQNGQAKSVTGQVLMRDLAKMLDGHGGIKSIQKISTVGGVDTYELTMADGTTFRYEVENGLTPTVEVARFSSSGRTGVNLTVTNPGRGNQLDQTTRVQIFDGPAGAPGANGKSSTIEATRVEDGVNLVITTPTGETGPDTTTVSVPLFDGVTPSRNWLDNSDFRFAVNQRGKTNYVVKDDVPVDAIDRWTLLSNWSEMSIAKDKSVVCSGMFLQNLSKEAETGLAGKTVTVVVEDRYDRIWLASGSFSSGFSATLDDLTISVGPTALILTTNNISLYEPRIGLYEGEYTKDSRPKYYYKGYAAELDECQRYYNPSAVNAVQPDWNQNDPTAPDYIKNRPFYGDEELICVQEPQMVSLGSYAWIDNAEHFLHNTYPDGTVFALHFGTDKYIGTYKSGTGEGYVGNGALHPYYSSLPDSGEGFCIFCGGVDVLGIVTKKPMTVCEASVYKVVGELKKIDSKYLPSMEPYVIDSEAYTYGDDALAAILEGRQILVKVPNKNTTNTLYSNFMPVLQYQLPNDNNNYLILFYLKDGIAENLLTALQAAMQGNTSAFDGVYGVIEMMLSQSYAKCPLKVSPIK